MTHQEKLSQAPSPSEEELLQLDEQQLKEVSGGAKVMEHPFPQNRVNAQGLEFRLRLVQHDPHDGPFPNGTYIPPSDPDALRVIGLHQTVDEIHQELLKRLAPLGVNGDDKQDEKEKQKQNEVARVGDAGAAIAGGEPGHQGIDALVALGEEERKWRCEMASCGTARRSC